MILTQEKTTTVLETGDLVTMAFQKVGPPVLRVKRGEETIIWKHRHGEGAYPRISGICLKDPGGPEVRNRYAQNFFGIMEGFVGLAFTVVKIRDDAVTAEFHEYEELAA